jgi:hypothetical protein
VTARREPSALKASDVTTGGAEYFGGLAALTATALALAGVSSTAPCAIQSVMSLIWAALSGSRFFGISALPLARTLICSTR